MKVLRRSRRERVLFGVCGGFGEYFGIDPDLVRAGWILVGLAGGFGVAPYVAAILLLPESPEHAAEHRDRLAANVGLVLIALSGATFLRSVGLSITDWWSWRLVLPMLLGGGGVLLVWPRTRGVLGIGPGAPLRRSVSNRVLAGVCGGLSVKLGTDANLVRILFVLASVATTGVALLLYLLLIAVVPEEESPGGSSSPSAQETSSAPPAGVEEGFWPVGQGSPEPDR